MSFQLDSAMHALDTAKEAVVKEAKDIAAFNEVSFYRFLHLSHLTYRD